MSEPSQRARRNLRGVRLRSTHEHPARGVARGPVGATTSTSSASTCSSPLSRPQARLDRSRIHQLQRDRLVTPGVAGRGVLSRVALHIVPLSRLGVASRSSNQGGSSPGACRPLECGRDRTSHCESRAPWTCRRPTRRTSREGAGSATRRSPPSKASSSTCLRIAEGPRRLCDRGRAARR